MKSVLISIQPKWCELIANGKKTIEVRKSKPKFETPFKCYIYCTEKDYNKIFCVDKFMHKVFLNGNGKQKIIGEFVCDKVTDARYIGGDEFYAKSCLTYEDWRSYTDGTKNTIWLWHISNLVIYDKPRELSEFWKADKCPYAFKQLCTYKGHCFRSGQVERCGEILTRPPQSWCYVEIESDSE